MHQSQKKAKIRVPLEPGKTWSERLEFRVHGFVGLKVPGLKIRSSEL